MDLPVIVATRMSLSFPLLFKSRALYAEDYEIFRIVRGLGAKPERRIRRIWMSDGGISSNFPIHLFDAPLPTRPTLPSA
jgi:predicted acylesterase/phospholipase RssA